MFTLATNELLLVAGVSPSPPCARNRLGSTAHAPAATVAERRAHGVRSQVSPAPIYASWSSARVMLSSRTSSGAGSVASSTTSPTAAHATLKSARHGHCVWSEIKQRG